MKRERGAALGGEKRETVEGRRVGELGMGAERRRSMCGTVSVYIELGVSGSGGTPSSYSNWHHGLCLPVNAWPNTQTAPSTLSI